MTIPELKSTNPVVSFDQSANFKCSVHGKRSGAYFIRGVVSQYVCTHCWGPLPEEETKALYTAEQCKQIEEQRKSERIDSDKQWDEKMNDQDWPF